jgi:hypothetical protein
LKHHESEEKYNVLPTWRMVTVRVDFRSVVSPPAAGKCRGRPAIATIQGGTVHHNPPTLDELATFKAVDLGT